MRIITDISKQRIIQELVPGRQLTLAHIIANPDGALLRSLEIEGNSVASAIGIMTVTPLETAIIMADIALKSAGLGLVSVDRVSGSLIVTGTVSQVEAGVAAILEYVEQKLGFEICTLTKT